MDEQKAKQAMLAVLLKQAAAGSAPAAAQAYRLLSGDDPVPMPERPKRARGRPCKLTKRVADFLVSAVRDGVPMIRAARLAGIHPSTFAMWMEHGRTGQGDIYVDLYDRVEAARDELCFEAIRIQRGLLSNRDPNVRASASRFVLTYVFSSEFSTKAQVEATGKDGGPVQVEHSGEVTAKVVPLFTDEQLASMSPEQLRAALLGIEGPA